MDTPCCALHVLHHRFSVVFRLSRNIRTLPHSAAHIICALTVALTRTLHVHPAHGCVLLSAVIQCYYNAVPTHALNSNAQVLLPRCCCGTTC
jgi:hypothetical protein